MRKSLTITGIIRRSEQGATRPFLCESGALNYYVKGSYAGKNSLCCEWVASRLAKRMLAGFILDIPEFGIAEVPRSLINGSARQDIRDLGEGFVFASREIEDSRELTWKAAQGWPDETMALLLLIDLWLQNEDRSLSPLGGNPNLLVSPSPYQPKPDIWKGEPKREMLWAYDFNLAFDEDFNRARFFSAHVFGGMLEQWPSGFREQMGPRMRKYLKLVPEIFAELPLEWLHVDGDDTLPVQLDMKRVISVLELPFANPTSFWTLR